jgi:predicted transposase YbfD/YdcC
MGQLRFWFAEGGAFAESLPARRSVMSSSQSTSILEHFADLTDPRRREGTYPLINVVVIGVCSVICGADDFVAMAEFGRSKRKFLEQFLDLSAGIPSHDRFNAIFAAIKPAEFETCLLNWITALHQVTAGQVVAIDGKTLRRSYDKANSKSAIHMVSAWATANHISLGQTVVDQKSNEITAIPELLKMLELSGCLVTIDAMGCQVKIARAIVDADANYVLAVKGNQKSLHNSIHRYFKDHQSDDFARVVIDRHRTHERGHGRDETRLYFTCCVPEQVVDQERWPKLTAIGMAVNITVRDGQQTREVRYYILSTALTARAFGETVRSHWAIENRCHWQLDVTFGEDQCRIRKGHADANFSVLRRMAISMLKNNHSRHVGIKNKRMIAALDETYLTEVLLGK